MSLMIDQDRLNPFFFRAVVPTEELELPARQRGLNPFFFRAVVPTASMSI
jgi:hypothetical protein